MLRGLSSPSDLGRRSTAPTKPYSLMPSALCFGCFPSGHIPLGQSLQVHKMCYYSRQLVILSSWLIYFPLESIPVRKVRDMTADEASESCRSPSLWEAMPTTRSCHSGMSPSRGSTLVLNCHDALRRPQGCKTEPDGQDLVH